MDNCETLIDNILIADNIIGKGAAFYCTGGVFNIHNSKIVRNKGYYSAEGYCISGCAFGENNVVYENNTSRDNTHRCSVQH